MAVGCGVCGCRCCVEWHFGCFWLFVLVMFVYLDYLLFTGGFDRWVVLVTVDDALIVLIFELLVDVMYNCYCMLVNFWLWYLLLLVVGSWLLFGLVVALNLRLVALWWVGDLLDLAGSFWVCVW